jgi:hypothetical protein
MLPLPMWIVLAIALFIWMDGLPWLAFHFGSLTRTEKFIRPDPKCPRCEGDGRYWHPLGVSVDCIFGCNEPKPQQVVHRRTVEHIHGLALRMGLPEKKADQFSRDFTNLANSYLGPPIPCFVRVEKNAARD